MFQLIPTSRLPAQSVLLSVASNKAQLIKAIIQDLKEHKDDHVQNSLVVTGPEPTPVEMHGPGDDEDVGNIVHRHDLRNTQEEADTILLHQVS